MWSVPQTVARQQLSFACWSDRTDVKTAQIPHQNRLLPRKMLTAFQVMWFWHERVQSKKKLARTVCGQTYLPHALHIVRYVSKTRTEYFSYLARTMLRGRTLALSKIASIRFKSSFGNWTTMSPKMDEWRCNSIVDVRHSLTIRLICDSGTLSLTRAVPVPRWTLFLGTYMRPYLESCQYW